MIVDINGKLFNPPKQWYDNPFTRRLWDEELRQTYKENSIFIDHWRINELRILCGAKPRSLFG